MKSLDLPEATLSNLKVTVDKYGGLEATVVLHFAPRPRDVARLTELLTGYVAAALTATATQGTLADLADASTGELP